MAIHVFVVDHQETFLRLMEQILRADGHEATSCPAGDPAHELIARTQPDVVVVDTWLQVRDEGWELVQTLRLDERTRQIPIIVASSDAERVKERAEEISAMNNVLILPKPFDPESLLRAIARITGGEGWSTDQEAQVDSPPK
jgi:two-component system, chemotaxis family, sensor kinase CheA